MKFSICIPVYNVEKYLAECLESIIRQSFNDFEIICVNDGSTDNSSTILDHYSSMDKRIKVINKNNQGLLWARRDAIKVAQGDYILFIDSDDKYHDINVLQTLKDRIEKYNNPDMILFDRADYYNDSVSYTCGCIFNEETLFNPNNINDIRYVFITRNYLNAMFLKCVKKDIIKKDSTNYSSFNPQMAEDITQSIYLFDKCKTILYIPTTLYLYRNNASSITNSPLLFETLEGKMARETFKVLFQSIEKWHINHSHPDVYQKFYNKAYSFYCDRIVELKRNKNNKNVTKWCLSFDFFNPGNEFLNNIQTLILASLTKSYKYIILGLIKHSHIKLSIGLFLNNLKRANK